MFRICIPQGLTHMFFWYILIRLMCFYLHILQHTILSFHFRPWLPNMFTHLFAKTIFLFTKFLLQRHCSSHRIRCTVIIIFRLHKINNDLHLHTETVKQNGAIMFMDCQYYLPIFITWSLLKSKVLVLRTWVDDPQLWVQNAKKTFRSCKKDEYFFPLVVIC
jgi:hypothetical protein